MGKNIFCAFLCFLLLCGCAAQPQQETRLDSANGIYPYTFTDDTGNEVTLTEPPKKVAVLLSSLADLWITAGGSVDITVGETVERGLAPESVLLVDDGAGKTINVETLVSAEPDLVLYSSDLSGQLECADTLSAANIPAAGFAVETFEGYLRGLKIATDILGTPDRYEIYGVQVQERINELTTAAQNQKTQPQILFVRAGSAAKFTKAKTAENHFACAMLDELGTYNIANNAPVLLDGLSTEEVLLSDPDFIFYTTMGDERAAIAYMDSLLADPVWQSMTVVKERRVYQLPKELFQYKPNARWAEAYEYMIALLYGDIL
jgi:iron complex transport system substrate-binding protein